jgi:DNA-binding NarL/FixJ family response regulator
MSRVFLLDDHHIVRDGLRSVLMAAGHDVVGDTNVAEGALDQMVLRKVEVLILDIHLQLGTGLQVQKDIVRQNLDIRTVVLTMSAQPRHVTEALQMGALGYVLKGSPASELLQAIASVQMGRRFLGEGVIILGSETGLASSPLTQLSSRELQILNLVVRGKTSAAIAAHLALSPKTVETYRSRLMTKLGIHDIPALVRFAIVWGLLEMHEQPGI